MGGSEITPKHDSTLGLIFRLNGLWAEVDRYAIDGKYNLWNNVLDALWRNLCYRNPMERVLDGNNKLIKIKLSKSDFEEWDLLNKNINIARKNWLIAKKKCPNKVRIYWARIYKRIEDKDLYLRKKMMDLKLYIKETKKTPGSALFG